MQNFEFENKLLSQNNKTEIKFLWQNIFCDDEEKTINYFLENVFENKKGVGAFLNNKLVAMILFLNSKIISDNKEIKSVYFYAVCTDEKYRNKGVMRNLFSFAVEEAKKQGYKICFLVPENEGLFKMYERLSFERTISYEQRAVKRFDVDSKKTITTITDFCYNDYLKVKQGSRYKQPFVMWEKPEFEFIFNKNRNDVVFTFTNKSFVVYEKKDKQILIYEICGDEDEVLYLLFNQYSDCNEIVLRIPVNDSKTDFGMTLSLDDVAASVNSIYFGMPYG